MTVTYNPTEIADQLQGIKDQMKDLLNEAKELVRGTSEERRAEAYWLAIIACELDDDHTFLSRDYTMQETIDSIRGEAQN